MCASLSLVVLLASTVAEPTPTARELIDKSLAARQAVQSGEVRLHFETIDGESEEILSGLTSDFHIWFDFTEERRRIRADLTRSTGVSGKIKGQDQAVTTVSNEGRSVWRHVLTGEHFISWSPDELSNGMTLGARYGSLEHLDSVPSVKHEIIDPRLIGMTASSSGHFIHRNLESFLEKFGKGNATVSRDEIDGRSVWKVEAPSQRGGATRMWIDPAAGFNVIKGESDHRFPEDYKYGRRKISTFDVELVRYSDAGVWFPKRVTLSITIDGQLKRTERQIVRSARLNVPIDPKVFTLAGVGLRPGTQVIDQTGAEATNRIWDGEQLTSRWPRTDIAAQVIPAGQDSGSFRFWLIAVNLAALAVIFLWLAIRSLRRRSATGGN